MKDFFYQQDEKAQEIEVFPHIMEFACKKMEKAIPNSLRFHKNRGIEFCYVENGQYNWQIEGEVYSLYPQYGSITCPWQVHGNPEGVLELGVLHWLILQPYQFDPDGRLQLGPWSRLSVQDQKEIGFVLARNDRPIFHHSVEMLEYFEHLNKELLEPQAFSTHRVNALIDDLLIYVSRKIAIEQKENKEQPFKVVLEEVHQQLLTRLDYKWSVDEMADVAGYRKTSFYHQMKSYTGFSPVEFLTQLRIKEAKQLLHSTQKSITEIALHCGFYSSQHFATVFKKLTGQTPRQFRRRDLDFGVDEVVDW